MTPEELENWKNVEYRMEAEGFHYAFKGYSTYSEIKDKEFHRLREAYLKAAEDLENYVIQKASEDVID